MKSGKSFAIADEAGYILFHKRHAGSLLSYYQRGDKDERMGQSAEIGNEGVGIEVRGRGGRESPR